MATSMINPAQSFPTPPQSGQSSATAANSLTSEDTFLKLLVSQIKNQDPLNPTDGVQFLTQLTGFSQLEQLMQINQELAPTATTSTGASGSGTSGSGTSGSDTSGTNGTNSAG